MDNVNKYNLAPIVSIC